MSAPEIRSIVRDMISGLSRSDRRKGDETIARMLLKQFRQVAKTPDLQGIQNRQFIDITCNELRQQRLERTKATRLV